MNLHKYINRIALCALMGMSLTACGDFLDRPAEDSYNAGTFYKDDTQCVQGVNYLYNSPWYDFQRGFIKVGEVMSGNYYWSASPYMTFTVNGTDEDLVNMSYSLWSVIGHANTVYNNLKGATASENVKRQCMGECLAWKAMAYFYLVRSFGDVPIVHDNSAMLADGSYSNTHKVKKEVKLTRSYRLLFGRRFVGEGVSYQERFVCQRQRTTQYRRFEKGSDVCQG